jgi:hypothetical protein
VYRLDPCDARVQCFIRHGVIPRKSKRLWQLSRLRRRQLCFGSFDESASTENGNRGRLSWQSLLSNEMVMGHESPSLVFTVGSIQSGAFGTVAIIALILIATALFVGRYLKMW